MLEPKKNDASVEIKTIPNASIRILLIKEKNMNTENLIARTVGLLFILTMIVGMFDAYLVAPTLKTSLEIINQNQFRLIIGAFLILSMSLGVVGIAIFLYPLIKKYNEFIAVGYLSFRIIECILLLIGAIVYFFLTKLSSGFINTATITDPQYLALFNLSVDMRYAGYQLAMITLGFGSIFLCALFYKTRLIPRFLSVWGLIGYIFLTVSGILDVLGVVDTVNGAGALLYIPGGVWELIVFPAWLFIKGFNTHDVKQERITANI